MSRYKPDAGLHAGFVMEQVLGHVTHYQTLRRVVERESDVVPHWIEVTYRGDGWVERAAPLPRAVRSTLRGAVEVRNGLHRRPVDALLFHTHKPAVFQWDLLARIPSVLSLDVTPRQYDALGHFYDHSPDGHGRAAEVKHWLNKRTFGLARLLVVWSSWVKHSLVADYDVPPEKVRVIPPGVDLSLWTARPEHHAGTSLPRVLFVGGDFERKGGPLLLDWFRAHGRGRCELDLVTRADLLDEAGIRVHRGVVGNSREALRLFSGADLFVLPTLGECFGIASVEAMAAGLPVITTRVGGSVDIVDDGQTGYLIEPGSLDDLSTSMDRLLGDEELRRSMGGLGRSRAEQLFDAATNTRALLACLEAAVA